MPIFSDRHSHKTVGVARADSVGIDAHKQLFAPLGCGVVLFKDPRPSLLERSQTSSTVGIFLTLKAVRRCANYIIRAGSDDLGQWSVEGSRPANAVYLHCNLNVFGRKGLGALFDRTVEGAAGGSAAGGAELRFEDEVEIFKFG
eukprot:g13141.t1